MTMSKKRIIKKAPRNSAPLKQGGRVTIWACVPVETAEAIRDCARNETRSRSSVTSEVLVAVFGGPKGVKS